MVSRRASTFNRNLRRAVLPAALLSLTACSTMDAAPNGIEPEVQLTAQKQNKGQARGKPVNVVRDGGFEGAAAPSAWSSSVLAGVRVEGAGAHKGVAWALLGASDASVETLTQELTIPKGRARLEFYLYDAATGEGTFEALVDGQPLFAYTSAAAADQSEVEEDDELADGDEQENEDGSSDHQLSTGSHAASNVEDDDNAEDDDFTAGYEKVKFDVSGFADDGVHTITFRLTDSGTGLASLSLDEVALEVKLLKELVAPIVQQVNALRLPQAVSKPLITKLDKAASALDRAKTKDAIKELKAFVKEVRGQRGKKLQPAAADSLILSAQEVIELAD